MVEGGEMKTMGKVQAMNSRIELHVCGHVFTIHFVPTKVLRYFLIKKWVFNGRAK
jgi:hypothetical protein